MSPHINLDMDTIGQFCRKWRIAEFALFGSVLREDFGPGSDVDVLVTFAPDSRITLFDLSHMEDELTAILGRKAILSSAEVIYAA